jgi:hypothetical protein
MRALILIAILLAVPGLARATAPMAEATPLPVELAAPPPSPAPDARAASVGVFDGYLAGAVAAGAFVGAVVVQIVTSGIVAPALLATTPVGAAAVIATGGVYAYEAIAGGIGGGLFGSWLYSRHAPTP